MKITRALLVFVFVCISNALVAQHSLSLRIEGVKSDYGDICFALYTDESSFLKFDKVFKSGSHKAVKGKTNIEIKELPEGNYAIAIFHDENGNKKLDTNMLGIPKEKIAFSKGKMKMFGPPKFDECAFMLKSNLQMTISFP